MSTSATVPPEIWTHLTPDLTPNRSEWLRPLGGLQRVRRPPCGRERGVTANPECDTNQQPELYRANDIGSQPMGGRPRKVYRSPWEARVLLPPALGPPFRFNATGGSAFSVGVIPLRSSLSLPGADTAMHRVVSCIPWA